MAAAKHELPPPPIPPARGLWEPTRKASGTFTVDTDAETPTRNPTAQDWRRLAEVFELLSPDRRAEWAELGHLLRRLNPEQRKRLLDLAIEMNGLG